MFDSVRKIKGFLLHHLMCGSPRTFWSLALVAHLPLFTIYLLQMCRLEQYHFVPFLLVAVAALAWNRIIVPIRFPTGAFVSTLLAASLLALTIACFVFSPWFAAIGFVLLAGSFLLTHGQFSLCVPLLLLIRLPMNLDVDMVTRLQTITSRLSSYVLDLLGLPHLLLGNVIQLAERELFVAEACSGVQSAFSIAFFALLIVAWRRRPLLLAPLYLAIALILALLCNALRVIAIAYMLGRFDIDWSEGLMHMALGYSTLVLAGLLTFSADAMLAFIFHPIEIEGAVEDNLAIRSWNWMFDSPSPTVLKPLRLSEPSRSNETTNFAGLPHRGFSMTILVIGLFSLISLVTDNQNASASVAIVSDDPILEQSAHLLEGLNAAVQFQYAETMRGSTDPRLGKNADQWDARYLNLSGRLVFSHPYEGWHDLNICYRGVGWTDIETSLIQPSEMMSDRTRLAFTRFVRSDGASGYLLFTAIDASGDIMSPPENLDGLLALALKRCGSLLGVMPQQPVTNQSCAMLQLWVVAEDEIEHEQLMALVDAVAKARERFSSAMSSKIQLPEATKPTSDVRSETAVPNSAFD